MLSNCWSTRKVRSAPRTWRRSSIESRTKSSGYRWDGYIQAWFPIVTKKLAREFFVWQTMQKLKTGTTGELALYESICWVDGRFSKPQGTTDNNEIPKMGFSWHAGANQWHLTTAHYKRLGWAINSLALSMIFVPEFIKLRGLARS